MHVSISCFHLTFFCCNSYLSNFCTYFLFNFCMNFWSFSEFLQDRWNINQCSNWFMGESSITVSILKVSRVILWHQLQVQVEAWVTHHPSISQDTIPSYLIIRRLWGIVWGSMYFNGEKNGRTGGIINTMYSDNELLMLRKKAIMSDRASPVLEFWK